MNGATPAKKTSGSRRLDGRVREVFGNIWDWHDSGAWVVIPVNVGWKRNGENVMGRGVAAQARIRMAKLGINLPLELGAMQRAVDGREVVFLTAPWRLIYFPTKPLAKNPALSWQGPSTLSIIARSAWGLARLLGHPDLKSISDDLRTRPVALPLVGTGCGGLHEDSVLPILRAHLVSDQFVLVRQKQ